MQNIECSFCGKNDIRFGLMLCANCGAEISYLYRGSKYSAEDVLKLEDMGSKLSQIATPPQSIFGAFLLGVKEAQFDRLQKEFDVFELQAALRERKAQAHREATGYEETIIFERNGRSNQIVVTVAPNGELSPATYSVILIDIGKKKVGVTHLISQHFGVGVRESIKLAEALPLQISETFDLKEAEGLAERFNKLGANCEVVSSN